MLRELQRVVLKVYLLGRYHFFRFKDRFYQNPKFTRFEHVSRITKNQGFKAVTVTGKAYYVKFCRNPQNKVPDICEREVLTYLFGRLLGVPILETHIAPTNEHTPSPDGEDFVRGKFVYTPFMFDGDLGKIREAEIMKKLIRKNIKGIALTLAFYHWYGEDDRGIEDVLIDREHVYFIDHGLSGPSEKNALLESAHPSEVSYSERDIVKKCFPGKLSLIDYLSGVTANFKLDDRNSTNVLIDAMPERIIRHYVTESKVLHSEYFARTLVARQKNVFRRYENWMHELIKFGL